MGCCILGLEYPTRSSDVTTCSTIRISYNILRIQHWNSSIDKHACTFSVYLNFH